LKSQRGLTPLAVALSQGHVDTTNILVKLGVDLNARDEEDVTKGTLLYTSIKNGDFTAFDFLVKSKAKLEEKNLDGQTPLNLAACAGTSSMVESLLDADAVVDDTDIGGFTPLLSVAQRGHAAVATVLIRKGANREAHDPRRGRRPLYWAAVNGNCALISVLLGLQCKKDAKDHQGSTPIVLCFEHENNDAASLLLSAGAILTSANKEDMTPLQAVLQIENGPRIDDYVPAPELSPLGFMSRGAQATTEILKSRTLELSVSIIFYN
jgi:ankyrin repeat protein